MNELVTRCWKVGLLYLWSCYKYPAMIAGEFLAAPDGKWVFSRSRWKVDLLESSKPTTLT